MFTHIFPRNPCRLQIIYIYIISPITQPIEEVTCVLHTIHTPKVMPESAKTARLEEIMSVLVSEATGGIELHDKIIVFVSRKYRCDQLANDLWEKGYAVDCIHGDRVS